MAVIRTLWPSLLYLQHAAAIMLNGGRAISNTSGAKLPDWFLETWELAASDQAKLATFDQAIQKFSDVRLAADHEAIQSSTNLQLNQNTRTSNAELGPLSSENIFNFRSPGLCFASPMGSMVKEYWNAIKKDVEAGKQQAGSMKIIFAGLIRNAEGSVRASYDMLKHFASHFKDYHFLLYENDSSDGTVKVLNEIAQEDVRYEFRSEVLQMTNESKLEHSRMKRMAILRNKVHDMIKTFMHKNSEWDLVAMYDFDLNLFGENVISPHAFFGALGRKETKNNDWDMLCANSLRHRFMKTLEDRPDTDELIEFDCFAFRGLYNDGFNNDCLGTPRPPISSYSLIPVDSCFGGLTLYKPHKFLDCRYDPEVYDCEHVVLHQCMRKKGSQGRMFMDPMLTTSYDKFIDMRCVSDGLRDFVSFNSRPIWKQYPFSKL